MLDVITEAKGPARCTSVQSSPHAAFLAALTGDGDSRIAVEPDTGTNRYFCPPEPATRGLCFASCTGSPISAPAFATATAAYATLASAPNRALALEDLAASIRQRLLAHYGVTGSADIVLCASGTDAARLLATLLASERPGVPITNILAAPAETGSLMPLAVQAQHAPDAPACPTITVPLRDPPTRLWRLPAPRSPDALNAAFAQAAASVQGRAVIHLIHGSKTGLIAPLEPPDTAEIVVDACQNRIAPATLRGYLARGWPVMITGSKFYGGPPFSGALLLPRGRWHLPHPSKTSLGVVLRWLAALEGMDRFRDLADPATRIAEHATAIMLGIQSLPALRLAPGTSITGPGWDEQPTIFTFGVHRANGRFRSATELRGPYRSMARRGVLLGQPVELNGECGGLRIAIGAADLWDTTWQAKLDTLFATLAAYWS